MYSYDTSVQCSPDRNLCSFTEHPVSYHLIFNFNVITTIFRLGNRTLVLSQYHHVSFLTRDLHSLSILSIIIRHIDTVRVIYLNYMQYRYNVDMPYYNIKYRQRQKATLFFQWISERSLLTK